MAASDRIEFTLSDFARAMRMDKRTVSSVLESSGLNASKRGPAITYPAIDGLRALVDHRNTPDGEISPADQRNLAQAEKLRVEAAVLRREWMPVADAVRQIGVTEVTYYRWRQEYGGLKLDQVKRLKELELENARLRRAVSDLTLDKLILKEAARGNY